MIPFEHNPGNDFGRLLWATGVMRFSANFVRSVAPPALWQAAEYVDSCTDRTVGGGEEGKEREGEGS